MRKYSLLALTLIGGLSCFSESAVAQWRPIPPPRYEAVPPPPRGPHMVWQGGAWDWDGRGYVWRPGRYVGWRSRYHHWVPGHWARRGVWAPAHWG